MSWPLFILGIILFISLIMVHEWGHFIMARRNGVDVEEFGLFFPPRLFKHRTKGGWDFTINLLPLGGYVKLKGEHDTDTGKGTYGAASVWAKTKIMGAGVVMNLITGLVLLTIVALVGMPVVLPHQFTVKRDTKTSRSEVLAVQVEKGSPAAKEGIQSDDQLVAIGQGKDLTKLTDSDKLPSVTQRYAGQPVTVVYKHKGIEHQATTTLLSKQVVEASRKTNNPKGYLGVVPTGFTLQRSTWSAPIVAVGFAGQLTAVTFQGLGKALAGIGSTIAGGVTGNTPARQHGQTAAANTVSGPVGIVVLLKDGSILGYQFTLWIIAVISLTLAIMNILPIPALDGGRLWLTLITRAFKKPLSPLLEERITAGGMAVLLTLIVLITVVDIKRFF